MATTPKTPEAQEPASAIGKLLKSTTDAVRGFLSDAGAQYVSIDTAINGCVDAIVSLRASIQRETKSKKTQKSVTLPDWDGKSADYRDWKKNVLDPMIEELIPASFRGSLKTTLQNRVQDKVKKTATASQLDHLGMTKKSKSQTQNEKRNADKQKPRASEESYSIDSLTAYVAAAELGEGSTAVRHTLADATFEVVAMTEALHARTRNENLAEMPKKERENVQKLLKQGIDHLIATGALYVAAGAMAKTEASGVKIAA